MPKERSDFVMSDLPPQVCLFCQKTSHAILVRATDIRVSDDGICGACVAQAVRSLSDHGDWGKFR